jgi:S1-C subfamily serine protease
MASRNPLRAFLLAAVSALGAAGAAAGDEVVFAKTQPATLCIEVIGQLYNGTEEIAGRGSGFFLNDQRSALTGNHIFPAENLYKSILVKARIRTDDEKPDLVVALTVKHKDVARDLALLEADAPVPSSYLVHGDSRKVRPGARLIVIGCPLTFGPTITNGNVGNVRDDPSGRWLVDAPVNPGNSGGPVLSEAGELVGVVWGGIRKTGEGVPIYGLNYVIPIHQAIDGVIRERSIKIYSAPSLLGSPVRAAASGGVLADARMGMADRVKPKANVGRSSIRAMRESSVTPMSGGSPFGEASSPSDLSFPLTLPLPPVPVFEPTAKPRLPDPVKRFSRAFEIRQMKDDHPSVAPSTEKYILRFTADPGFRFSAFEFGELSRNHGSPPVIEMSPDAKEIAVSFSLTSGPVFDRYRGWLDGTLVTRQTRE